MGSRFDTIFRVSIILKGLDALIEIIGGVLLLFVTTSEITRVVAWLTRNLLAENSHSTIATYLTHSAQHLTVGSTLFGALYLLSHGVIKMFVVVNVLRDKYWAYPLLIVVIFGFIIYQVIDIITKHSIGMTLLTIFDIFVITLTWLEWQKKRKIRAEKLAKEESSITD